MGEGTIKATLEAVNEVETCQSPLQVAGLASHLSFPASLLLPETAENVSVVDYIYQHDNRLTSSLGGESGNEQSEQMALQLSVTETHVDHGDPWADDLLNRKETATRLVELLQGQRNSLRVSVDGGWGSGKTFFLRRLHATLEDRGCRVCYVDVSQSDFTRSHLTTLLNSVRPWLDSDMGLLKRSWHKVFRFFKRRQSEQTTLGLNLGLLTVQHEFGYSFDDDDRLQETLRAFKGQLQQVAQRGLEESGLPTLIIIDELDRCRPGYALEVLQAVRHLFDVPGVTFIFGVNRSELVESLKLACGNIDVETYLQKFFDLSFSLPRTGLAKYARVALQKYDVETAFGIDDEGTDWSQATDRTKEVYGAWRAIPDFLPCSVSIGNSLFGRLISWLGLRPCTLPICPESQAYTSGLSS